MMNSMCSCVVADPCGGDCKFNTVAQSGDGNFHGQIGRRVLTSESEAHESGGSMILVLVDPGTVLRV